MKLFNRTVFNNRVFNVGRQEQPTYGSSQDTKKIKRKYQKIQNQNIIILLN